MQAQPERHENEFLSVLRQDPQQTRMLVKVGVVLPLTIIIWQIGATLILPLMAVAPVTIAMILLYGGALIYLTGRIIRAHYKGQLDSARSMSRISGTSGNAAGQPLLLKDVIAALQEAQPQTQQVMEGQFHEAYFLLRLQEEVLKARREGLRLSVFVLDVTVPDGSNRPEVLAKVARDVAELASKQAKTLSLALQTGESEFAFAMPGADRNDVKPYISKLVGALGDYWCHYGLAVYPADETNAEGLLDVARETCQESREGRESSAVRTRLGALIKR